MVNKSLISLLSLIGIVSAFRFPYLSVNRHRQLLTSNHHDLSKLHAKNPLIENYGPFTMDMPLDHFSKKTGGNNTFTNRYWVNADHYQNNGPIILSNGGEGAIEDASSTIFGSTMVQLAERLGGIFVYMEHRYYGQSTPEKSEFTYLMTDQALADMAHLIKNIKFNNTLQVPPVPETKVIVYGCSYSGNLAAWMRDKYPDLVFAAVASSAPVEAQFNFYQYFDPIIRYGPKKCIQSIQNVIAYIDSILFGNSASAVRQLKAKFGVEELYDDDFASYLTLPLGEYWQYGINATNNQFDEVLCASVFNSENTQKNIEAYASHLKSFADEGACRSFKSISDCVGTHNTTNVIEQMQQNPDIASWTWQTCVEFGYFQVAAPQDKPTIVSRKLQTTLFERTCQLYFSGMNVPKQPNIEKTNRQYGGWAIKLDRVLWMDGEWDSWRELSVLSEQAKRQDISSDNSGIIIPKATHCANVDGVHRDTPQHLIDIQNQQYNILKNWLTQSN